MMTGGPQGCWRCGGAKGAGSGAARVLIRSSAVEGLWACSKLTADGLKLNAGPVRWCELRAFVPTCNFRVIDWLIRSMVIIPPHSTCTSLSQALTLYNGYDNKRGEVAGFVMFN